MKKIVNLIFCLFVWFYAFSLECLAAEKPIQVVATVGYLRDVFREVTCDSKNFEVDVVVPASIDLHTYQMTASDRRDIELADFFLFVGSGLESWLMPLQKKELRKNWFEASRDLTLRKFVPVGHDDHHHAGVDLHIWHSPDLTLQIARRLGDDLIVRFPSLATEIKKCKNQLELKMIDARRKLQMQFETMWPKAKPKAIALNHDALAYFADFLGFKVVPLLGFSTNDAVTPKLLKTAIAQVKKANVAVVFFEVTNPSRDAQNIAKQLGLKFGGHLFADGLGPQGSGAETTFGMWARNLDIILAGVK